MLDCGCGPGRMAIQAAKRVKKVICLDSSEGILAECRKNCADDGVENVDSYLTGKDGGWYFFLPTSSDVTWFRTR